MLQYGINEISVLKNQPKKEIAQRLLERIAKAVLPIAIKHKFRVRLLQEFLPLDPQLLGKNENRGVIIYIRCKN